TSSGKPRIIAGGKGAFQESKFLHSERALLTDLRSIGNNSRPERRNDPMRHFRFCQLVWLMLVVILLQTAAILTLPGSSPPQSGNSTPAFAQSQLESNDSCCEEISFVSAELSLRCEGQSKQGFALIRSFTLLAVAQQRDAYL